MKALRTNKHPQFLFAISCLLTASAGACSSVSEDGQRWAEPPQDSDELQEADEEVGALRQPLTGTHKVCSVAIAGNFRDSIVVPNSWDVADCRAFGASMNAPVFNLACMSDDGFLGFGSGDGGKPAINTCGW